MQEREILNLTVDRPFADSGVDVSRSSNDKMQQLQEAVHGGTAIKITYMHRIFVKYQLRRRHSLHTWNPEHSVCERLCSQTMPRHKRPLINDTDITAWHNHDGSATA